MHFSQFISISDITSQMLLISLLDHFLPDCFLFRVLYTIYSSDLAVLYLIHSK